ncbi:MAG: F0F1 ATP synthase subunit delta, partial [Clostridia bacterium]|nr:F0F1 ATP synthase subunit delta [Clostridia bacterium]
MQYLYAAVNFLILAALVWLLLGKSIRRIFSSRRERINAELDEAEAIEAELSRGLPAPADEPLPLPAEDGLAPLRERFEHEKRRRIDEAERRMAEDRREAMVKARSLAADELIERIRMKFREEDTVRAIRKTEPQLAEKILEMIAVTPGDMCYLMHHDVLYVTLTSAFPLDQELVDRIGERAEKLLSGVGGRPSYWVKVDPELIGGLRLRIGDTVYDCTVENRLYHLKHKLKESPLPQQISAEDVIRSLGEGLAAQGPEVDEFQLGRVLSVSDVICRLDGLADIMYGEVVEFECGERGMILDIEPDRIGCVVFGKYEKIETLSRVRRVGRIASVPVGDELLGRVVDPLGRALDGGERIRGRERRPIEFKAPGIPDRKTVDVPLHTGLKAVDALVPIGRGQRELIIGDRQTGKSAIAIDAIIN